MFAISGEARAASSMTWRRPSEGLLLTTKGKKEGSGGKMANFFVAIAHGKGVVLCKHHEWKITGENFGLNIVEGEFPKVFETCGSLPGKRTFLQDGCPRQNAKAASKIWKKMGYECFNIPPRSPDLNPIENLFHLVREKLKTSARESDIHRESYEDFVKRVEDIITGMPVETIDNLISSMPNRLKEVRKHKGNRTRY